MKTGMAYGFPLYIDLHDNNCVVLGGGKFAASRAKTLFEIRREGDGHQPGAVRGAA